MLSMAAASVIVIFGIFLVIVCIADAHNKILREIQEIRELIHDEN